MFLFFKYGQWASLLTYLLFAPRPVVQVSVSCRTKNMGILMNYGVKYVDRYVGEWFQACLITERWWVQCLILFLLILSVSALLEKELHAEKQD